MFLNDLLRVVSYPDSYRDAQTRQPKADSNSARLPSRQRREDAHLPCRCPFRNKGRIVSGTGGIKSRRAWTTLRTLFAKYETLEANMQGIGAAALNEVKAIADSPPMTLAEWCAPKNKNVL